MIANILQKRGIGGEWRACVESTNMLSGTTAQTFDLGVNGDASLFAGASLKDASPAAAAYDVDNFTTFVTRVVPAGSVLTLDLNAGSDSTFQVTCRVNYFEYS